MRTLFAVALALLSATAQAQYPNRAVRVIVAAQTGGPDIVARVVAAELLRELPRDDARHDVRAAGLRRDHHAHRAVRVLGVRSRGYQ